LLKLKIHHKIRNMFLHSCWCISFIVMSGLIGFKKRAYLLLAAWKPAKPVCLSSRAVGPMKSEARIVPLFLRPRGLAQGD
jgi:hypothetical protein